jgi:hypothetical protein
MIRLWAQLTLVKTQKLPTAQLTGAELSQRPHCLIREVYRVTDSQAGTGRSADFASWVRHLSWSMNTQPTLSRSLRSALVCAMVAAATPWISAQSSTSGSGSGSSSGNDATRSGAHSSAGASSNAGNASAGQKGNASGRASATSPRTGSANAAGTVGTTGSELSNSLGADGSGGTGPTMDRPGAGAGAEQHTPGAVQSGAAGGSNVGSGPSGARQQTITDHTRDPGRGSDDAKRSGNAGRQERERGKYNSGGSDSPAEKHSDDQGSKDGPADRVESSAQDKENVGTGDSSPSRNR